MKEHLKTTANEDTQLLKQEYLARLALTSNAAESLRETVQRLVQLGTTRRELVNWAIEAGYGEGYARTVLSKILCDLGLRARKPGAGSQVPQEALVILAFASQFGERAEKFLRSAARVARNQRLTQTTQPALQILAYH